MLQTTGGSRKSSFVDFGLKRFRLMSILYIAHCLIAGTIGYYLPKIGSMLPSLATSPNDFITPLLATFVFLIMAGLLGLSWIVMTAGMLVLIIKRMKNRTKAG
ncbi:hypothetical protein EBB07_15730 [Paenibacillaceae bacterium]|nr:hypothetical protein EBB07_15730 [Paenibacillaceae bacterium]